MPQGLMEYEKWQHIKTYVRENQHSNCTTNELLPFALNGCGV